MMDQANLSGEVVGYIASGLVFLTFYMKTMLPLRFVAIASNVAFIAYGAIYNLVPILILHSLLLPLNVYRTRQIWELVRKSNEMQTAQINIENLLPLMTFERLRAGDTIFRRGDVSEKLYYIAEGKVEILEVDATLSAGGWFGEIGLFADDKMRTASARCKTDCQLYSMSESQVKQLYFQDPQFGYYVLRLITQRLIEDVRKLEGQDRPAGKRGTAAVTK